MDGERRRVVVLFLDLVGFTRLGAFLDHEVLHRVTSRIMGLLSAVARSYGGYVDKLEGDRIMVLFGARVAAENDSARAVSCALRLLSLLDELAPLLPEGGLPARVGIASGPVTVAPDAGGHLTAIGTPVNLASRLEETAPPGSVLADQTVMRECGGLFLWRDEGAMEVRGFPSQVPVYTPLEPSRNAPEKWHRPAAPSGGSMVGRDRELNLLSRLLSRCRKGGGGPVLVRLTGEPGIGKSRLLHQFLSEAGEGVRVLHGHADPFAQPPLHLWTDLFRRHLAGDECGTLEEWGERLASIAMSCPDSETSHALTSVVPLLAGLLCRGGAVNRGADPGRSSAFALKLLLQSLCAFSPVVLALEDLHWIDEPSLETLRIVLARADLPGPLMVVTTERPPGLELPDPVPGARTISLEPLRDEDVRSMAGNILGAAAGGEGVMDEATGELIVRAARGNPFFAEELTMGLIDSGSIRAGAGATWRLAVRPEEMSIPASVHALVQTRIDRLPERERRTLQFASVQGKQFRTDVLQLSMGSHHPGLDVAASVAVLEDLGFLNRDEGPVRRFRHDLVQRAAFETLLRHNRKVIHRSIAMALEALFPGAQQETAIQLYRHWEAAGERDRILEMAPVAMQVAGGGGQIEEAIGIADHVIAITDGGAVGNDLTARLTALGTKQSLLSRTGRNREALQVVELMYADAAGDPEWEAEALRAMAIACQEDGLVDRVEPLLNQALERAMRAGAEELQGRVLGTLANHHSDTGRTETARELYLGAMEIQQRLGNRTQTAALYSNIANLYARLGDHRASELYYRNAVALQTELGDRISLGYALNGLAICLARTGDLDGARQHFAEALAVHTETGNRREQAAVLTNLGTVARMRGDLQTSLEYRTRSLKIAEETGSPSSQAIALVNIGNLRRLMGHPEETAGYCERALRISTEIKDSITACFCHSIHGLAALDMKDAKLAVELQSRATAILDEHGIPPGVVDDYHDLTERMESSGLVPERPSGWKG